MSDTKQVTSLLLVSLSKSHVRHDIFLISTDLIYIDIYVILVDSKILLKAQKSRL